MIKMNNYMKRMIRGKKILGSGGTRVVYDLDNGYVIKIAKSQKGIRCNKMEVTLYRSSPNAIKKYFAPIINYDKVYRWLIMKKYIQKFPSDSLIYKRQLRQLVKKFLDQGIIPSKGIGRYYNPYAPNLRLKHLRLKGSKQIVVIDYGGFKYAHKS
ncbi:hypothetical protein ACFQZT_19930 [Paenibacillus sp. GCM10027628]|uniref:hypothetical protein n=1 Tax=Paenibacillus sp. GCM10027628 TaxID=3273413 RepID=UPI00362C7BE5